MGVQVTNPVKGEAVLWDSVTGKTFGYVFSSDLEAEEFLEFAKKNGVDDVRRISETEFDDLYNAYMLEQEAALNRPGLKLVTD